MDINITRNSQELGRVAGEAAASLIREAINIKGSANIILATGTSQFSTLNQLITETDIDWAKVVMFHLDEYIGLPVTHPASFRKYLQERFLSKVPKLKSAHLINGETDPGAECIRLNSLISNCPIDVALVGIGENGHLAFNDPPANFDIEDPYIIVDLDRNCRKQQWAEGWFDSIEDVPEKAISMSIKQILKSKHIVCSIPDTRKAVAVKNSLERPVSNLFPASILQLHPNCSFYLDQASSALLSAKAFA
jgi:glucosamine-6-phosphate deaminase